MNILINFLKDNPQIGAAIITATCGVLGIFVNIAINIAFRNKDYKNKNRLKKIENLELYYLPLYDSILDVIDDLSVLSEEGIKNFSEISSGDLQSKYDSFINNVVKSLNSLNTCFATEAYRYQDDYKLFKLHREAKRKCLYILNGIKNGETIKDDAVSCFIEQLKELSYKIKYCEAKIMTRNNLKGLWECYKIWKSKIKNNK